LFLLQMQPLLRARHVAGLFHRVVCAALLSASVWIYVNLPIAEGAGAAYYGIDYEEVRRIPKPKDLETHHVDSGYLFVAELRSRVSSKRDSMTTSPAFSAVHRLSS